MHCQQCKKALRSGESVKCADCESRFHLKCVASKDKEAGDRGYHWKCAVCHHPAGKCGSRSQLLLHAINQMSEKFELVNKVQLPKLNSDLMFLKSTTDKIVKQNEDILSRIEQLERDEQKKQDTSKQPRGHRRKPLYLSKNCAEGGEEVPVIPTSDKYARYRTRQRSYHLYKVFLLVNRKLHKTRTHK